MDGITNEQLKSLVERLDKIIEQQEDILYRLGELEERVANISTPGCDFETRGEL